MIFSLDIGTLTGPETKCITCTVEITEKNVLYISGTLYKQDDKQIDRHGQIRNLFQHKNAKDNDPLLIGLIKPEQIQFNNNWDASMWYTFLEIWKDYHMNDTQPGCVHQRILNWGNKKIFKDGTYHLSKNITWLEHPDGHLLKKCPLCHHPYGGRAVFVEIPEKVIAWLKSLPNKI